jgi:aubergine-like protein
MFIGVDVFHAPMAYNAVTKSRGRKASCAAIIVEIIRDNAKTKMEIYSKTFKRTGGEEYNLAEPLRDAVAQAVKLLNVKPASVVVWRDGIGESSFTLAQEEIRGVRDGLSGATVGQGTKSTPIPLAYVVCQKRIATKFLVEQEGSKALGAPTGTLVSSVTSLNEPTFYITGTAPPFSTPKPTRFTVLEQDKGLARLDLPRLSSAQCYDYPNWTGPIKVPATVQMAHKLAELGGQFSDCGESINATKYVGRPYFL